LDEIGFSDHNPMPTQFDQWRMAPEELTRYLEMVEEARASAPGFPVRIGLECDYIPGYETHIRQLAEKYPWDYLIGSVHYVDDDWDVDSPFKRDLWKRHTVDAVWKKYFDRLELAIESRLFDFIGHPDLVKKFGDRPEGDLKRFYLRTLDLMEATGVAYEVNTAGWRKPVAEQYPDQAFLEEAFRRGIPVLVNSDAHAPEEVASGFHEAFALLHEVGYRSVVRFVGREAVLTPLG
jgi:histidinol-phosphatase (PHP family)